MTLFRIFAERSLREIFEARLEAAKQDINNRQEDELVDVDADSIIDYLTRRHQLQRLVLHCDQMYATDRQEQIPAEEFPRHIPVRPGKTYPKPVFTWHIPAEGNTELLWYGETRYVNWTHRVELNGSEVTFKLIDFGESDESVKRLDDEAKGIRRDMRMHHERFDREVASFNETLRRQIAEIVHQRRQRVEAHARRRELLSVPVRRKPASSLPATLAVPVVRKQVVVDPVLPAKLREKEWFLGDVVYDDILKLIHDWGVVMERHPSTYAGKDEEAIRDLFLLLLTPHFEYTGGETFNKSGKTDILIRHEKKNVFVAECKIWHGKELFLQAVDQLLGYLTWRDSKAALLLFVRNVEIDPVIQQIAPIMHGHSCFIGFRGSPTKGWLNFELRLTQKDTKTVKCAVLLFHLPEVSESAPGEVTAKEAPAGKVKRVKGKKGM